MKIASRYSKSFYSDRLSDKKYQEICKQAIFLNEIRNELSQKVNSDLLFFLDMTKFDFYKFMLPEIKDRVGSNFTNQLFEDVYVSYQNKFEGIRRRLRFEQIYDYKFTYYKRDTKYHKKGNLKGISKKRKLLIYL